MKDQVRAMMERNISAVYTGGIDDSTEADIIDGKYQLVFFATVRRTLLWFHADTPSRIFVGDNCIPCS